MLLRRPILVFTAAMLAAPAASVFAGWAFVERSADVGLDFSHSYAPSDFPWHKITSGLAIGDLNGDGWDDIFAVTGQPEDSRGPASNPNKLFISNQDGTYSEQAAAWGLNASDEFSTGPLIADFDGDGHRDLLVGGVRGSNLSMTPGRIRLYMNSGASSFSDETDSSGLFNLLDQSLNFGMAAADTDRDGDLDLFFAHWQSVDQPKLLQNNGSAVFTDITDTHMDGDQPLSIFTPIFTDINNDGWDDLLLSSDFAHSTYFINNGAGSFVQQDSAVLTDENGMGGAAADYDNDGDVDWFTSSIHDSDGVSEANWGVTGNRLYNNSGSGVWTDTSDAAGVREGYWGWGACFADFNNDMHLDLYHVNGYPASALEDEDEFDDDPARMFVSNGNGTFAENSAALGVADTGNGRAILCFDNDHDGDLDILVHNNLGVSRFFQNELSNGNHWLQIKLVQPGLNHDAIGAKIRLTAGGVNQFRQVIAGGNFSSSHPTTQHFGLAENTEATSIQVTWPDGSISIWENKTADRLLVLCKFSPDPGLFNSSFEQIESFACEEA